MKRVCSAGCGAVGSVPALGAGGPEFESRHPDKKEFWQLKLCP